MPQELFITHCTTCRARLKVYNQDAIGQILSCPKCGSMVQVAPPPDWKPPVAAAAVVATPPNVNVKAAPASPQPATKVAAKTMAAPAAALGVPSVAPQNASRAPASPATATAAAATLSPPQLPPVQTSANGRAATVAAAASGVITVTNPGATRAAVAASVLAVPPPVEPPPLQGSVSLATGSVAASAGRWSHIASRLRQDWWMLAGGFLAGVVVGGGVWLAVLLSGAPNTAGTDKTAVAANSAAAGVNVTTNKPAAEAENAAEPSGLHRVEKPAIETAVDEAPLKPFPTKQPTRDDDAAVEPPAEKPAVGEKASDEATEADAEPTAEAPAEGDAADLLDGQLAIPQDVPPPAGSPVAIEKASDEKSNDEKATDDKPNGNQANEAAADPKATADAAARPESTQQELAAERLASVLSPLDFEQVALNKFVTFLGQYTTVTIKIDRAALLKAGIDYKAPVTVKRANTTVAQALRDALGPLELTYRLDKDTLLIIPAKRGAR